MQSLTAFNAHHRSEPLYGGPRLQAGDLVSWRNPATAAHWGGLRVEFVYPQIGVVLLRGNVGRVSLKTGASRIETVKVRLDQVTVEARAGE